MEEASFDAVGGQATLASQLWLKKWGVSTEMRTVVEWVGRGEGGVESLERVLRVGQAHLRR